MPAAPILHLSLPVRDLAEARAFYADTLGCEIGRERDGWFDAWFHGMQVTLHLEPAEVIPADRAGVRHFGVTLAADDLAALFGPPRVATRPVVAAPHHRRRGHRPRADEGEDRRPERERDRAEDLRRSRRRVRRLTARPTARR